MQASLSAPFQLLELSSTIKLFRYGSPFETGAVVRELAPQNFVESSPPWKFTASEDNQKVFLTASLGTHDKVRGFGQSIGSLNKRGSCVSTFARQSIPHLPDTVGLNGSYPFFIIECDTPTGFFFDFPSDIFFDIGFTTSDILEIVVSGTAFDLYMFTGESLPQIVSDYISLIGEPFFPPPWAFGYHQCRYSYETAERVREIAHDFRSRRLPCDAIYLDIDYMDDYRVFSVSPERFPEFEELAGEMHQRGFQLVPIIDPGVQVKTGYSIHDQGLDQDLFCTDSSGKTFEGRVWPGRTYFPDFFRRSVRTWWGEQFKCFQSAGINAFWNDMNEPEIFYTPEEFAKLSKLISTTDEKTFRDRDAIDFKDSIGHFWQKDSYYDELFHTLDDGTKVVHRSVHNLYSVRMLQAAHEGLKNLFPNRRPFLLSRSSSPGLHRIAGVWTGDNHSWWEHLAVNLQTVISLNMCGQFYCGADIGGHCGNPSGELLARWMQLGALIPLYRNHTVKHSRDQEPWAFGTELTNVMRSILELRYALFPYIYSSYRHAILNRVPFITPLFFHFNNQRSSEIEDQFFCGASMMAAPVITKNASGRMVYLPEGYWLLWKSSGRERRNLQVLNGGDHYIEAPLDVLPLILREDHLIALGPEQQFIGEHEVNHITIIGLVHECAEFTYYEDDGITESVKESKHALVQIKVQRVAGKIEISTSSEISKCWQQKLSSIDFEIFDREGGVYRTSLSL